MMWLAKQKWKTNKITHYDLSLGDRGVAGSSELLRRQNAEKLDLERRLVSEEEEALARLTADHDAKRQKIMDDMAEKLSNKLSGN